MALAKLSPYNPCTGGLTAKIWECLRRNLEFRTLLAGLRASASGDNDPFQELFGTIATNSFAFIAFGVIEAPNEYDGIEDKSWPKLPKSARVHFESFMRDYLPSPTLVSPPPFAMAAHLDREMAREAIKLWMFSSEELWSSHDIVAVPKFIRDEGHREDVLSALEKIVRTTRLRPVHLKDNGRVFGTEKEWETYLFVTKLEEEGESRQSAYEQAAWRFFEPESYRAFPNPRSKIGKLTAAGIYSKQSTHVINRVEAIKVAIKAVYPVFTFNY